MKWSWRVGSIAGIALYVHATFVILLGWVGASNWIRTRQIPAVVEGVGFILALFGCIVLHELGHALAARRYGIPTRDITLLPIGGVARLERMPEEPLQELWVALAGPLVNVVIAAVLYGWLSLAGAWQPLNPSTLTEGLSLERLVLVNLFIVGFNLLPAFPMDGGRVLRALLATRLDYTRATQLAASLGQGMALVFVFLGLIGNPFLLFIAFFVWIGAGQEAAMAQMKSALGGIPVSRAMITDFRPLQPADRLRVAVEYLLKGTQQDFPVLEDGQVVGVLLRSDLLAALAQSGPDTMVGDIMRREFEVVDSYEMLETAFSRMQNSTTRTLPVMHSGRLVGLLTPDNVGEFVAVQTALATARTGPAAARP